ncbi:MAG TPA: prepilin-type N-terminal cleavage/methylation domain-containing protein [Campylobacterales bacterium]|nr:prepilin-type N-terminal cleavage/methylation domain-containing protein [Campylobacterales bacterium]HHS92760.1 prepilin-type N-terminal cleavage/methylation domain-containing protein [Campylobacterales bacterium]
MRKFGLKKGFTLIEVIISVIIVSIVVMGALQIQAQNSDMGTYLLKRGSAELDNALFLTKKAQRYSNDKKSAYDLLVDEFSIKDFESRDVLKKLEKTINITEAQPIPVGIDENEAPMFVFYTNEILLNGEYPARYYTYK